MILTDLEVTKNAAVKSVHTTRDKRAFSLAELIIAIALLSIFGVIAARMFFIADQLTERTEQLDRAVVLTANIAESWQAAPLQGEIPITGDEMMAGFEPQAFAGDLKNGKAWSVNLDQNMRAVDLPSEFVLEVELRQGSEVGLWLLNIEVCPQDSDIPLYDLSVSRYFPGEVR